MHLIDGKLQPTAFCNTCSILQGSAVRYSSIHLLCCFQEKLIISSRNYGTTRSAGEIMRAAFSEYGMAGGHRSMAKAVIPLEKLSEKKIKDSGMFVRKLFLGCYKTP